MNYKVIVFPTDEEKKKKKKPQLLLIILIVLTGKMCYLGKKKL